MTIVVTKVLDLDDDILFGIFFSGYLGYEWRQLKEVALTCRTFFSIASERIGKLVIDEITNPDFYLQSCAKILKRVTFLDVAFSTLQYSTESLQSIGQWTSSLRGVTFRNTSISDIQLQMMQDFANGCPLNLLSLDLSKGKTSARTEITDLGLQTFSRCRQLKWLNLSMTNISNDGLRIISHSFPNLELLGIQCCSEITDAGIQWLCQLPLSFLDISGCLHLTKGVIAYICDNR
jgi:hypothetical protein